MLNLILDTNAWIYLANGFNPETNKSEEETHFQTAEWVLEKTENKECIVFSNYIIKLEWERNKEKANELIKRYEAHLNRKNNELKNKRKQSNFRVLAISHRDLESSVRSNIEKNKAHIKTVEQILKNSIEIPVRDEHKLNAVDLAINKKPPFHHKDNSVADAIIFISTVDYFCYNEEYPIDNTIFISNNTSDFGESVNNKSLHPDLSKMLGDKPIIFKTNLAEVLGMGEEIIAKYKRYLDYIHRDTIMCLMNCKGTEYYMAEVEFTEHVDIEIDENGYSYNPKQLLLNFGEDYSFTTDDLIQMQNNRFITVDLGKCSFCHAKHIRCVCGNECSTYGNTIYCTCGKKYSLDNRVELIKE